MRSTFIEFKGSMTIMMLIGVSSIIVAGLLTSLGFIQGFAIGLLIGFYSAFQLSVWVLKKRQVK